MQFGLRRTLLSSFLFLIILAVYILWPWIHAGYTWRRSTIKTLESPKNSSSNPIPRIIHQTYRDIHSIPYQWQQASNSCRTLHSNYEYKFWTDEQGRQLIEKVFPCLLSTFDSYPYNIQRADVIRLVVLYVYGGIYIDFDIICLKSLDQLLQYQFILPRTIPVGLSNDLILSKPKHPFLFKVINNLPKSNRNYFTK
jgi:mannosyltransferase OCH1-like enzyme